MSPITSLSIIVTSPNSTVSLSFYFPRPTPYDPITPQSTQSTQDTIQRITFGTLGIFFAGTSVFIGYLQLRLMRRTLTMPFNVLEPPVRNNGRFSSSSYNQNETDIEQGRTLSMEPEVQSSVETRRDGRPPDSRMEELRAESVYEIRTVDEAQGGW